MRLRWKQGTGEMPEGALYISEHVWQVLQQFKESMCVGEEGHWLDIPVVIDLE